MDLNEMKAKEMPTEKKTFEELPEAQYEAQITNASINLETKKISWEFTIAKGEFAKRRKWENTPITGAGTFFTNQMLRPFGQKIPEDLNALPGILEKLIGKNVLIYVYPAKAKDGSRYINPRNPDKIYMNTKIDALVPEGGGSIDLGSDIPF